MIDHTIIKNKNYAYISVRQSPGLEVFLHAAKLFASDPDFEPDLNRLCDFSQANLSHLTESDLTRFVEFAIGGVPLGADAKVALVAPEEEKWGIFKQFSDQILSGQFRIYSDPDEAVEWITAAECAPS